MPVNGHTSGVSVFGSDETNTVRGQRRRRMRARRKVFARQLRRKGYRERVDYWNGNNPDDLLLLRDFALVERLRDRRGGAFRDSATRLVCAAIHLASFVAG